ncbi:hypothetical protein [Vibrio sp. ER1A]|uniref:hypothetical protein n=1 Tax=Vibrio sp. ER1A TaxID=1517681 RepID=UPI0004DD4028|nr:hypothetical protein [Vibrio sp. ER1A]KFA99245.1 hypothetical protein HW45_04970 [Vibrio sp. ER1A]
MARKINRERKIMSIYRYGSFEGEYYCAFWSDGFIESVFISIEVDEFSFLEKASKNKFRVDFCEGEVN